MKIITERTISRTDKVTERRILEIPDDDFIHFTREYCTQNEAKNPYSDEIQLYPTQKQGVSASNLRFSERIGREFDAFSTDIRTVILRKISIRIILAILSLKPDLPSVER